MSIAPLTTQAAKPLDVQATERSTCSGVTAGRPNVEMRQFCYVLEGGTQTGFVPLSPSHPIFLFVELREGGVLAVDVGKDKPLEIQLGCDFIDGLAVGSGDDDSVKPKLTVLGRNQFELVGPDNYREVFSYNRESDSYGVHRSFVDIVKFDIGDSRATFGADGVLFVGGRQLDATSNWKERLGDGRTLTCTSSLVTDLSSGAEFFYDRRERRWFYAFREQSPWSFGEILNGENSVSTDLLGGLITVFANGGVTLFNTHTFPQGSEIDQALLDDEGNCCLYVRRARSSREIYLHEDNTKEPTGILHFEPEYFAGKDGETMYPAWLYAASNSSLPAGRAGTDFFGAVFALLLAVLGVTAIFSPYAQLSLAMLITVFVVRPALRSLFVDIRLALGV